MTKSSYGAARISTPEGSAFDASVQEVGDVADCEVSWGPIERLC